jgi:heme/copper-type cytochrome/quinol oxidase subunit 3
VGAVVTDTAAVGVVDVSALESHAIGEPAPLWWGVLLMVTIEGAMFVAFLGAYLYLRNAADVWPPLGTDLPDRLPGALTMALLLASAVPQWLADRLAAHASERVIRWMLVIATVVSAAPLVPRMYEFGAMHCRWDSHAYGSIVWVMLGMHTIHLLASVLETGVLAIYTFVRPLDPKHRLDLNVNSLYWYFVVAAWVPMYVTIYFGPVLL